MGELRLTHGDAKSSNYLVTDDGRLWPIDLDSMRFHRLEATFRLARRRDWKRFMRNWQSAPELAEAFHSAVERSTHLWIAPAHFRTLSSAHLAEFDAMMNTTNGRVLRRLADRENWRLDLIDDGGTLRGAYLKKHRFRTAGTWLRARLCLGPGRTAGRVEADHVRNLSRQGIPTMSLIAFGERLDADGRLASFLLTEELAGCTQLDHFLDERFPVDAPDGNPHLRELIGRVADVARRFHRLGYNHRDFYTCHFFIREKETGRFDVHLIDLQRVQHRKRFRRRWLVKDLAQLAYSAPPHCIGCRERMDFIKGYLGVRKLRRRDKRFIRSILAKERRMRHKLGPYR